MISRDDEELIELLQLSEFPPSKSEPPESIDSDILFSVAKSGVESSFPSECFAPDSANAIGLHHDYGWKNAARAADGYLTCLIARGLQFTPNFMVAITSDLAHGGPYVDVWSRDGIVEFTVFSNFALLENQEEWFERVMQAYEWQSERTGLLSTRAYRKAWSSQIPIMTLATQVSELIVFLFNPFRYGSFSVVTDLHNDEVTERLGRIRIGPCMSDKTFASNHVVSQRQSVREIKAARTNESREMSLGRKAVLELSHQAESKMDSETPAFVDRLRDGLECRSEYLQSMFTIVETLLMNNPEPDDDLREHLEWWNL